MHNVFETQSEKNIQNSVLKFLKGLENTYAVKFHANMYTQRGVPDILCCINSQFVAFEIKKKDGKLSDLQRLNIDRIQNAGGKAYVVRSLKEVKDILDREFKG